MTAEAVSAAAQPGPGQIPCRVAQPQAPPARRPANRSLRAPGRKDAHPMCDDLVVTDLVTTARNGSKQAWDALVERYAPLVWSICRRHQLGGTDAGNVAQIVWLQLLDHLSSVPHPAALPGWLAPPRPGGNAAGSCAQHGDRKQPGMRRTLIAPQANRSARRSRSCRSPGGTRRCARRWPTSPVLPAADRPAHRESSRAGHRNQRQAGYPRSGASGPTAAAALTSCAITRPSRR